VITLECVGVAVRAEVNGLASHYRQLRSAGAFDDRFHNRLEIVTATPVTAGCRRPVPSTPTCSTGQMDHLVFPNAAEIF
jgi:hypothetical protein